MGKPEFVLVGEGEQRFPFPFQRDNESIGEISIAATEGRISGILARRRGRGAAAGGFAKRRAAEAGTDCPRAGVPSSLTRVGGEIDGRGR